MQQSVDQDKHRTTRGEVLSRCTICTQAHSRHDHEAAGRRRVIISRRPRHWKIHDFELLDDTTEPL